MLPIRSGLLLIAGPPALRGTFDSLAFVVMGDEVVNFPTPASVNTGCESGSDSKRSSRRLFTVGSESARPGEADQLPHPDQPSGPSSIADDIFHPRIR